MELVAKGFGRAEIVVRGFLVDARPFESLAYEERLEPHVLVARKVTPAYDGRFRGHGLDKISRLHVLAVRGLRLARARPLMFSS